MGQFPSSWLARLKVESMNKREPLTSLPAPLERDLHDTIEAVCRALGWCFIHSRMDQRTTCTKGTPDFVIYAKRGQQYNVEVKRPGQKLSPDQQAFGAHLARLGHSYHVIHSMKEFDEVIGV